MAKIITLQKQAGTKHKKLILLVACAVLVLVLVPVTALAYIGSVPGLTEVMGANKPADLGVRYTSADLNSLVSGSSPNLTFGNYDSSGLTQKRITDLFISNTASLRKQSLPPS